MEDSQERRIAAGLRAGAADAWAALYDAFAEPVWRGLARLMGPSSADVADVVQETFLAAARSARGYDQAKGTLWSWLWGIARNQLALHHRKRGQRDRLALGVLNNGELLASPQPAERLEAAERVEIVRRTFNELPPDYESLLTAKYLDDVSVEELARRERSTEIAVRSKLARARAAFRQAYEKQLQPAKPSGGVQPRREPLPPA